MRHENADQPDREGARWEEEDYRTFADGLHAGLDEVSIAQNLGRTRGSVRARARMLMGAVGVEDGVETGTVEDLRNFIRDDPSFDLCWLAHAAHEAGGPRLWRSMDDVFLRSAIEAGVPSLDALAERLGVAEARIVERMIRIKLVRNTLEAVERLGAAPDGDVFTRAAIARDKASAILWVLSVVDRARKHVHVSLHPTSEAADQALRELQPGEDDETDYRERWYWVIAERLVGEGAVRSTRDGSFSPRAVTP